LLISSVDKSSEGSYTCTAQNGIRAAIAKTINVTVNGESAAAVLVTRGSKFCFVVLVGLLGGVTDIAQNTASAILFNFTMLSSLHHCTHLCPAALLSRQPSPAAFENCKLFLRP
jgi:hypothetical protein